MEKGYAVHGLLSELSRLIIALLALYYLAPVYYWSACSIPKTAGCDGWISLGSLTGYYPVVQIHPENLLWYFLPAYLAAALLVLAASWAWKKGKGALFAPKSGEAGGRMGRPIPKR